MTNLSRQLCEICGLKYCKEKVVINTGQTPNVDIKPFYLNFELPENQIRLQKLLVDSGHTVTLVKDWYSVGCGLNDFIDDCYDTQHAMTGKTFLDAVYNYITLWYEQREVRYMLKNGKMGPPMDMSHKLEAEECICPWGYQSYVEDVEKLKQAIRETEWVYG